MAEGGQAPNSYQSHWKKTSLRALYSINRGELSRGKGFG